LLALLGAHHFLHVSRIRVNKTCSDLRMWGLDVNKSRRTASQNIW
jgi:biotin operon repressor